MVTKRQLGAGLSGLSTIALIAILAADWLNAGDFQGIGPVQRIMLVGAAFTLVVGLSLIPLGDRPA
jgi:hypothetical protein